MRGLSKGEESTTANPVLQLFCRSGQFLQDLVSGTFTIQDISDPAGEPVEKVSSTPFVEGTHKLGTGRYAILTGDTSAWALGTHRVICSYVMASGGPIYNQVIEFELLDSGDWATGTGYVGYASTRRLIADGHVKPTDNVQSIHRQINRISRQIEAWTKRWFDPRYLEIRADGVDGQTLFLEEAIIALSQVQAIWKNSSNEEESYDYDNYLFEVYNRHLDFGSVTDDRSNPKIVRADGMSWPAGTQGVKICGVFGFTDPEIDQGGGRVLLGKTPDELSKVVAILISREAKDPTSSNPTIQSPGSIKSMKTRHQQVQFFGASGSTRSLRSEPSGDAYIDNLLSRFGPPISVSYSGPRVDLTSPSDFDEFSR